MPRRYKHSHNRMVHRCRELMQRSQDNVTLRVTVLGRREWKFRASSACDS